MHHLLKDLNPRHERQHVHVPPFPPILRTTIADYRIGFRHGMDYQVVWAPPTLPHDA